MLASMVHVPSSDLRIVMMGVARQSKSSDCGVLAIAYAFDIWCGVFNGVRELCSIYSKHNCSSVMYKIINLELQKATHKCSFVLQVLYET